MPNDYFTYKLFNFFHFQTELSHNLQQLSERAKSTTEFIQRLKGMSDKVNVSKRLNNFSTCDNFFLFINFRKTVRILRPLLLLNAMLL